MTLPSLPASGSTSWYAHYSGIDAAVRGSVGLTALHPQPLVGEVVSLPYNNNTNGTFPANGVAIFIPMPLPPGTYDAARVGIQTAGTTGALVRAALYSDNGGDIGTLLSQTAAVDATTTGLKVLTFDTAIVSPVGGRLVWFTVVVQGAPTTLPVGQIVGDVNSRGGILYVKQAFATDMYYTTNWGPKATGITGAFPSTVTTTRSVFDGGCPKLDLRRSA